MAGATWGKTREEVLEIIREVPGCSVEEIQSMMPHVGKAGVGSVVNRLYGKGLVTREQVTRKSKAMYVYSIADVVVPPTIPKKLKEPTDAGWHERCLVAEAELAELREWKEQAVKRHPDLLVAPEILEARKLVSSTLKDMGDHNLAAEVLAGRKDAVPLMRVALRAMGGS